MTLIVRKKFIKKGRLLFETAFYEIVKIYLVIIIFLVSEILPSLLWHLTK